MITPNDLKNIISLGDAEELEIIEAKVDEGILKFHGWFPWEEAIIEGEYPVEIRNEIAKKYKENGWEFVYHQTSSENGERPGLTCFKFSMEELIDEHTKEKFYKV